MFPSEGWQPQGELLLDELLPLTMPVKIHFEDVKETKKEELCSLYHLTFLFWILKIQELKLLLTKIN